MYSKVYFYVVLSYLKNISLLQNIWNFLFRRIYLSTVVYIGEIKQETS